MAGKKVIDQYANVAAIKVVESAANTQTAEKFAFPFSIMDKMGLIIQRVEYTVIAFAPLAAAGDRIRAAITAAPTLVDIDDQSDPLIIDSMRINRLDSGAAANFHLIQTPYFRDFTNLAGGGILVAPNPLYAMVHGDSAGAAITVWFRLYYTYLEMATDEYWQLVESRRIISG